jgi:butyryl-CoA dehydrogenase
MDFSLTEEQKLIQQNAREFAEREVAPKARELDRTGRWPGEIFKAMGELGLLGIMVPTEYGGAGADAVSYALAMEEISRACAGTSVIMSVQNSLVCDSLVKYGTEAQKRDILTPLASGQQIGCFGLTEPASGSDAAHMETVAEKDGDHWVINGSKNWISGGPYADYMVVYVASDRSKGAKGVTALIVPKDTPGYLPQEPDEKLGIHAAQSCTVFFENCRIPRSLQLGEEGQGFKMAMATLDGGRIGIAAQAVGIARAAYEKAVAYSKERKAFGSLISEKQAIQFKLADMALQIDAARLLTLRAAWLKDRQKKEPGLRFSKESAMAKLHASETANRVAHQALQVFGGYGYSREYDMERHYRDARITEIYEGTSEIQRLVIASWALREH